MKTKPRHYIDFKLYLTAAPDGKGACQVALLPTPEVGESVTPVTVSAEQLPAPGLLAQLANKSITLRQLAILGKNLADCLLPEGDIRDLFKGAVRQAGSGEGIRLRLIITDHHLKQLPWEYVYLDLLGRPDGMHGFLALNPRISIVRHEPLPYPHPEETGFSGDLKDMRIMIVAALPQGERELQLEKEVNNIREAVRDFDMEGVRITCDPVLMDATPGELFKALRNAEPVSVFHFAGHGTTTVRKDWFNRGAEKEEGFLLFVEDKKTKKEARVNAEDLAKLLQPAGVRLAVLGACQSGARDERYPWDGVAGALVAQGIAAVIAMQYEVLDQQWISFSEAFYATLGIGMSLDEAVSAGRQSMQLMTNSDAGQPVNVEWAVPVLYSRLPEGALFPQRMANPAKAAADFRKIIDQNIGLIEKEGKVTGLVARRVGGGFEISQQVDVVSGDLTGAKAKTIDPGAKLTIKQKAKKVSGNVTGLITDDL